MMHARNSTREVEAGRSEVQGYPQLHSKLGYRKTCLKKKKFQGKSGCRGTYLSSQLFEKLRQED